MPRYRADWILPIADDVIRDGWIAVEGDRIAAVESGSAADAVDLGRVAILPALVNAHTHLELSYWHGRIPPAKRLVDWVRALMQARREGPEADDPRLIEAAARAVESARAAGTGLFGDVTNTLATVPILERADASARVFFEQIGFSVSDGAARMTDVRARIAEAPPAADRRIRISPAPHAPYSVSPALFTAIRADLDVHGDVSSVHLGESPEETEFVRRGTGPWRTLLEDLGAWTDRWQPPGSSPVKYLRDIGFLDRSVLAVHGVQFDGEDLTILRSLGVTIASCPRSNRHVGVGSPPLEAFYAMNVDVAFGTDSLASAPDLNLFAELAEARRLAPRVPAHRLLESATLVGARALGFGADLGAIEPGKRAALIAVRVPEGVADVEEYLVGGVEPDAVSWVEP